MDFLEIVLRTLLAVAVLLFLTRLDGPKQISQLTFYDYIVGITAGSIAATLCVDRDIPILYCLIGLLIFMLSSLLIGIGTSKSIVLRRLLTGSPIFLIDRGKLRYDGLKKAHYDVNDLMRELRSLGYFDIGQIQYAILECNGMISVLPKAAERPASAKETGLKLPEDELLANVVIDGKILKGNLAAMDKTVDWLERELERQGRKDIKKLVLVTLDPKGELNFYEKTVSDTERTVFQ